MGPKMQGLNALGLMGEIGARRIDDVVKVLDHENPEVVAAAITTLASMGSAGKPAIPALEATEKKYAKLAAEQYKKVLAEAKPPIKPETLKSIKEGVARSRAQAETIVNHLQGVGFSLDTISLLMPDQAGAKKSASPHGTKASEGAVAGAGTGGVLGGTLGLMAGIGALAIPGIGPLIAAGPLVGALSGIVTGATLGGIAGSLIGMGIPEHEARTYEKQLSSGNVLIALQVENSEQQARAIEAFKQAGAERVSTMAEAPMLKGQPARDLRR